MKGQPKTKLGRFLWILFWVLAALQAWLWSDEYFSSEGGFALYLQNVFALLVFFLFLIGVVELIAWPFRLWEQKQDRELEKVIAAEKWRKKKAMDEEARLDEIRARKEAEEAERPLRMERELLAIRKELLRLSANKPEQPKEKPPKTKPSFSGSIKTEEQALEVMDLQRPFTLSELKKRRAKLLQKTHPDQGGSTLLVRLVNEAYDILKAKV